MDVWSDVSINKVCCTCLSNDRKLEKLCNLKEGVNILCLLLSQDQEAYKEGFYRDTTTLQVCLKCKSIFRKIKLFREQAWAALKQLQTLTGGWQQKQHTVSNLTTQTLQKEKIKIADNFIDCGSPEENIKTEFDPDEIPLSELKDYINNDSGFNHIQSYTDEIHASTRSYDLTDLSRLTAVNVTHGNLMNKKENSSLVSIFVSGRDNDTISIENSNSTDNCDDKSVRNYSNSDLTDVNVIANDKELCQMTDDEMTDVTRDSIDFNLKDDNLTNKHYNKSLFIANINSKTVVKKLNNGLTDENVINNCNVTLTDHNVIMTDSKLKAVDIPVKSRKRSKANSYKDTFITKVLNEKELISNLEFRRNMLNGLFKCKPCVVEFKVENDLMLHNMELHTEQLKTSKCDICTANIQDIDIKKHRESHFCLYVCKMCEFNTNLLKDITIHAKKYHCDIQNNRSFPCAECRQVFQNKDARWKHVQKAHREGHKCSFCNKIFTFKSNLLRHEKSHTSPITRAPCPVCQKQIRIDLLPKHGSTHAERAKYKCIECDKTFVCLQTYRTHLKYAKPHAKNVCRFECPTCDKGYRSRGELRDHIDFQHKSRTRHTCPVCNKALATKRCIKRHVKRAHEGIKEKPKDKVCQRCGKTFMDNKGLREHEYIHSGLRPLSCDACGRSFRQAASLYHHRRRVHKLGPTPRIITVVQDA